MRGDTGELAQYPQLYWSEDWQKQSFRITSTQPGLDDVHFVPIAADFKEGTNASKRWSQSVSLLIINRNDSKTHLLPTHPVMAWDAAEIGLVAFRDVRGDGRRSIIVDVKGNTGPDRKPPCRSMFLRFTCRPATAGGSWTLDCKSVLNNAARLVKRSQLRNPISPRRSKRRHPQQRDWESICEVAPKRA
jgi:hypothetical protein